MNTPTNPILNAFDRLSYVLIRFMRFLGLLCIAFAVVAYMTDSYAPMWSALKASLYMLIPVYGPPLLARLLSR